MALVAVYGMEEAPEQYERSIFLAGPTPREGAAGSWHPSGIDCLERLHYDGVVFVPEGRGNRRYPPGGYDEWVDWESKMLGRADCIAFWVPRDMAGGMPGLTTNVEWGAWIDSGKVVAGWPDDADHVRFLEHRARRLCIDPRRTLERTMADAVDMTRQGAMRRMGERDVPLFVWRTPHFQSWYQAQRAAGHEMLGADLVWNFRVGGGFPLFWALQVRMQVFGEDRVKSNEVVIGRPDVCCVCLYEAGHDPLETPVVIVREYRSPVHTRDGFIRELAGGSAAKPHAGGAEEDRRVAALEVHEETSIDIDSRRLVAHESRQVAGTVSSHRAMLYSCALSPSEMRVARSLANGPLGVSADTERTYVEVGTLRQFLDAGATIGMGDVDWATYGMLCRVLLREPGAEWRKALQDPSLPDSVRDFPAPLRRERDPGGHRAEPRDDP